MTYTIFDTPVVRTLVRWFSIVFLWINGWRTQGALPAVPKMVMIAAPHTSNWDLPYMLFTAFALRAKLYWMGKDAIFRWPFKSLFKWLGGIPIDRLKSNNVVDQSIAHFAKNDTLILTVPPAGTRKRVLNWKTGFYHIANGAGVPIAMGFLDYKKKIGGIGPVLQPTGDIEADMAAIRSFYQDISGKYPLKSISTEVVKQTPAA
ncbi:MAG: glycerol acyltransferase [Desulfobacterales bacterium]|nr:glycerol acyltransferase [Desulfobacterales bacterium]